MRLIKYQIMTEINTGTEEEPQIEQVFNGCEIQCTEDKFDVNYAIALSEAYNGEVAVEDLGPDPASGDSSASIWEEMDAAYQEGVESI